MAPSLNANGRTPLVNARDVELRTSPDIENQESQEEIAENPASGYHLAWDDIRCMVADPKKPKGPATKEILCGVSGHVLPGQVLAIMGPSGAGKTSLLNILTNRPSLGKKGFWTGKMTLDGRTLWPNWERGMAYVMQKDVFYEELTVAEILSTTALLRLPYEWPRKQKLEHMEALVEKLGLSDVRETRIGTAISRGLSGGEVKRTSIANEMLQLPQLFILDEPLTGLDSTRAVEVMAALKQLASEKHTSVILTIHQPSSSLFEQFDQLLLLAPGGKIAFFGAAKEAVQHFESIGYPLPSYWTPPDHFIELLSHQADAVVESWKTRTPNVTDGSSNGSSQGAGGKARHESNVVMPPLCYQVGILFGRNFKRNRRLLCTKLNFALHGGLALTWGFLWWRVGDDVPRRLQDFVGIVFFFVAHWSWSPLFIGLMAFPQEKSILTKERAAKAYSVEAFFLSKVLAEFPLMFILPALFFAICYPMCGLPASVGFQLYLLIMLNVQVCAAFSMLISVLVMDQEASITVAIIAMVYQMCTGGYFADLRLLPPWISWCRFTSFFYYTNGFFLRLALVGPYGPEVHDMVTKKHSFSELGAIPEISILTLMIVLFRFLAYVVLRYTKKLKFE